MFREKNQLKHSVMQANDALFAQDSPQPAPYT